MTQFDIQAEQLISCGVPCTRCLQSVQKTETLAPPSPDTPLGEVLGQKTQQSKKGFCLLCEKCQSTLSLPCSVEYARTEGQIGELGNKPATGEGGGGEETRITLLDSFVFPCLCRRRRHRHRRCCCCNFPNHFSDSVGKLFKRLTSRHSGA